MDNACYSVVHSSNWSNFEIFTIMDQVICVYPMFILTQLSSNKGRNELKPIGSRPGSYCMCYISKSGGGGVSLSQSVFVRAERSDIKNVDLHLDYPSFITFVFV